ncbi:MAG TPA: CHASE domain-containing protein, partial [Fimbriimonas sp.]|nr:CHASE domain-containing protein [Fimbriimonas sp.]
MKSPISSAPYLALCFSVVLALSTWYLVGRVVGQRDQLRFDSMVGDVRDLINNRIDAQVSLTRATASFMATNPNATKADFRAFLERQGWPEKLQEVGSVGYSVHVPIGDIEKLRAHARAAGVTDFEISPVSGSAYIDAILFSEPYRPSSPHKGFDMHSEPKRAATMDKAMEFGEPVASEKLYLLNDTKRTTPAFIVCVPIYKTIEAPPTEQERKDDLQGFAYCSFRVRQTISPVFRALHGPQCTVRIYDGESTKDPSALLFDNTPVGRSGSFSWTESMMIKHRPWTVQYISSEAFDTNSGEMFIPWLLPLGLAISFLLFVLTFRQSAAQTELTRYAKETERRAASQSFLARAGAILGSSLNYRSTLGEVAKLAVPTLADWSAIDILSEDGEIQRLAVAHIDPQKVAWATELNRKYPLDPDAQFGVPAVLRTGKTEFYPSVTPDVLQVEQLRAEGGDLVREEQIRSLIVAPIRARGKTLGALSFVMGESGRTYSKDDLHLAEELAERAGLAMDNALLFASAQQELQERTRAEGEVRRLNEELEGIVEERTRELSVAIEELEAFCYSVSHDLRAPLRAMDGFSRALMEDYKDVLDDDGLDSLRRVRSAAKRMDELITSLLTLSRVTRAEINPQEIDISELSSQVASVYMEDNAALEVAIQPGMCGEGDPAMVRSLLENLIANAVKFSGKVPHPCVEIGSNDGVFFVKDNGAGFDPQFSNKL